MTKLTAGQWNVLANCASYGSTNSEEFAPSPRGTWTQAALKKLRSYEERVDALAAAGLVEVTFRLTGEIAITDAGIEALKAAGYAQNGAGYWLHPDKRTPGWAS